MQGKGIILTSDIGNVRHPYKCRDRTSLMAAFAELQVLTLLRVYGTVSHQSRKKKCCSGVQNQNSVYVRLEVIHINDALDGPVFRWANTNLAPAQVLLFFFRVSAPSTHCPRKI